MMEQEFFALNEYVDALGRKHKAKLTDATIIAALPRGGIPETYIAIKPDGMCAGRGYPSYQLGTLKIEGVRFFRDEYGDCPHCREDRNTKLVRENYRKWLEADGGFNYSYSDDFWCNDCQGTGWLLEPWDRVIKRLNIVTHEALVAALTDDALSAALERHDDIAWTFDGKGYPPSLLMKEAAKRLSTIRARATT